MQCATTSVEGGFPQFFDESRRFDSDSPAT